MDLKKLLISDRNNHKIDIVVFLSGGKDSSYALAIVCENVKNTSKIVAVTMDNGFLSKDALKNIHTLVQKYKIKHDFFKMPKSKLFAFYRNLNTKAKDLPRVTCVGCNILSERMENYALTKYNPKFFVTGNSQGEYKIFKQWLIDSKIKSTGSKNKEFEYRHGFWVYNTRILKSIFKNNRKMLNIFSLPEPKLQETNNSKRIYIFNFIKYDLKKINKKLKSIGWLTPNDVVGTETDCVYTQAIAQAHILKYGKINYINLINKLCMENKIDKITRDNAIKKLKNLNSYTGNDLLKKVGYNKTKNQSKIVLNAVKDLLPIR